MQSIEDIEAADESVGELTGTRQGPDETVSTRVGRVRREVEAVIEESDNRVLAERWPLWRARLAQIAMESAQPPRVVISLVGGTGAGKSTLLNALLDARILPVSNMRACTAAISEVSYAAGPGYSVTIEFVSPESWLGEIAQLRADIADGREIEQEDALESGSTTALSISRVARDKLRAVYDLPADLDFSTLDFDTLREPEGIARALAAGAQDFACADLDELGKRIKEYLDSDHAYWPIVKTVRIAGPFEALRCGVTLVDLPGINDPNEAREDVTKQYLKNCRFVWIVFNIKRVLTKDTLALMQSDDFLRQIVMDGRSDALTFVGTNADDVDPDTGRDEFKLDEDASDVEVVFGRNSAVRREVAQQLDELAVRLAYLAGENRESAAAIGENFKRSRVFTVSSRDYLRLMGIPRRGQTMLETPNQTEIPALRAHLTAVSAEYGVAAQQRSLHHQIDMVLEDIKTALRSQRLYLERRRTQGQSVQHEVEGVVQTAHTFLDSRLEYDRRTFVQALAGDEALLRERLKRGIDGARRELGTVTARWRGLHWGTLRATVRRRGSYLGRTGKQDFVADLAQPVLNAIVLVWANFFGDRLGVTLDSGQTHLLETSAEYGLQLTNRMVALGDGRPSLEDELAEIREMTRRVLDEQLSRTKSAMQQRIESERRSLYERIPEEIGANMIPAFDRAAQEKGTGVKMRMIAILEAQAEQVSGVMFEEAEEAIVAGLRELCDWLARQYGEMADTVDRHADMLGQNLTVGLGSSDPAAIAHEMENLNAVEAAINGLYHMLG